MKKIYFTLILILALAFALVIVSSATSVMYNSSDSAFNDMIEESSNPTYADLMTGQFSGSYVNYGNVANGNFTIFVMTLASYENSYETYVYWVSDIEAFQTRYSGYTYDNFLTELDNNGYYDLSYRFNESGFNYLLNYQPSISQEQFDRLALEYSTLEQTYNTLQGEYNTLESNYNSLQNEYELRVFMYNELQIEYNDLATRSENAYNTLQGEYNTLQVEYNTLQGEYNTLEGTIPVVRQEGYDQGLQDADALTNGLGVILSAPVYFLNNVFNFEILGFSMRSIFATIITVLTIAWVTKKLSY